MITKAYVTCVWANIYQNINLYVNFWILCLQFFSFSNLFMDSLHIWTYEILNGDVNNLVYMHVWIFTRSYQYSYRILFTVLIEFYFLLFWTYLWRHETILCFLCFVNWLNAVATSSNSYCDSLQVLTKSVCDECEYWNFAYVPSFMLMNIVY